MILNCFGLCLIILLVQKGNCRVPRNALRDSDTVALKSKVGSDNWLTCADNFFKKCKLSDCPADDNWEDCREVRFSIHGSRRRRPIRHGSKIGLLYGRGRNSSTWLTCDTGNFDCKSKMCPTNFRQGENENCGHEVEFMIFAPRRADNCLEDIYAGCEGDYIRNDDVVFLWSSGSEHGFNYWLSAQQSFKDVRTQSCPGKTINNQTISSCVTEAWTIYRDN